MAEKIYIADKQTLDSVKEDTVYIRNNVGGDFTYTQMVESQTDVSTPKNNLTENLKISIDGKGEITQIYLGSYSSYTGANTEINLRIVADGVEVINGVLLNKNGGASGSNIIPLRIKFKNNLQVYTTHLTQTSGSYSEDFIAIYNLF